MSGNHTPTPWRVDGYHSVIGPDGKEIHANGFSSIMSYGPAMLDARANAELIVTAVNSYASSQAEIERLKDLCRRAREMTSVMEKLTGCRGDDDWVWALQADLNAALSGSKE